jgi:hypothetical protein
MNVDSATPDFKPSANGTTPPHAPSPARPGAPARFTSSKPCGRREVPA